MKKWMVLFGVLLSWGNLLRAQPACVECCCGSPEEIGFPCGTFEEPPMAAPGGWIDYSAGQTYCGWTVVSGTISIHHGGHNNLGAGNPNGSSQHLDLNGSSPGTVERTLTGLQAGAQYTITLWYAAHNAAGTATCNAQINDGALLDETWSTSVPGSVDWEEKCLTFISDGPSVVLKFIGSSNNGCCGMLIDDMNLWECTPDTLPPTVAVTPDPLLEIPCSQPVPPAPTLDPEDDCDQDPELQLSEANLPQPCFYNVQRTWLLTDACGNSTSLQQVVEVRDTEAPVFSVAPSNYSIPCGGDYTQEFEDWLITNGGGGFATDNCDNGPVWTTTYGAEPDGSCGSVEVIFTITDDCGNQNSATATFSIADADPPAMVEEASDATVFCHPSPADTLAGWLAVQGGALAVDPCGPVTWSDDFNGDPSQPSITVTFTATDACGNTVSTTATFSQVSQSDTMLVESFTCDPQKAGSDTLSTGQAGCESVTITLTTLQPSDTLRLQTETCDPSQAGKDTLILQNRFGCDSLVISETVLLPSSVDTLTLYTCDPSQAGKDTLILQNQYGCDSIVYAETLFSGIYAETKSVELCGPGMPYSDTLVVTTGFCDSLFITAYSYLDPDTTYLQGTTCDPQQTGLSVEMLTNAQGCDSTVYTLRTLLPSDTTLIEGFTCNKAEELFQQFTLQNSFGCDSVVAVSIVYVGVDTQFVQTTTCDPSQAGTFIQTVPGTYCDTVRVMISLLLPTSTGRDTVISCASSGPAADTLVLTNFLGCDSIHITEYIYASLTAQASATDESCAGRSDGRIEVVSVTGGEPPLTYRLETGPEQSVPLFGDLSPGSYRVIVRDALGCADTLEGLTVGVGEIITVDAGPDRESIPGDVLTLLATTSTTPAQWQWSASDPLACATCAQTALGPLTASQTVTVSATTAVGCTGSDQLEVTIRQRPRVFIPNSFSPDFDGINDVFSVYGNELVVKVRYLAVYDRWGNALFLREDLPVNDPSQGWDGIYRERVMDPGVYVYTAELEFVDGSIRQYKGDVTLVR